MKNLSIVFLTGFYLFLISDLVNAESFNTEDIYKQDWYLKALGEYDNTKNIPSSLANKLNGEPCGNRIHRKVIKYLKRSSQSRQLANLTMKWAGDCKLGKPIIAGYLLEASMAYRIIGEIDKAKSAAEKMVALLPHSYQAKLQLAASQLILGEFESAIEQYTWVFQTIKPSKIGYSIYNKFIDSFENVGRGCDAIDLYRLMIRAKNPDNKDYIQGRINTLQNEYSCNSVESDSIQLRSYNGVVPIEVSINGVSGVFVFDTGATTTSVNLNFANKSGLIFNKKRIVRINTANGVSNAYASHAREINVENRGVGSGQVLVLQNTDSLGKYDGLLGMNIISRFSIEKNGSKWILK